MTADITIQDPTTPARTIRFRIFDSGKARIDDSVAGFATDTYRVSIESARKSYAKFTREFGFVRVAA
jgi:hypothetical protein